MGRTPQEELKIQQRRQQIADLYLKGQTQSAIAQALAVSQPTVSSDLKAIRRQWRDSQVRDFDEAVQLELKKLETVEREAWQGWQRSQLPQETSRVMQGTDGKRAEKTVRQQQGDPRYLELIQRTIAARRALLGLDAPTRIAPTSPDGEQSYHAHVMQELLRLAEVTAPAPIIIDSAFIEDQLRTARIARADAANSPTQSDPGAPA